MPYKDYKKHLEACHRWRKRNLKHARMISRKYYHSHKKEILKRMYKNYWKDPEKHRRMARLSYEKVKAKKTNKRK